MSWCSAVLRCCSDSEAPSPQYVCSSSRGNDSLLVPRCVSYVILASTADSLDNDEGYLLCLDICDCEHLISVECARHGSCLGFSCMLDTPM
eukprot:2131956-Amphidinium_carterae.4